MIAVVHVWWVATMRGVAALTVALIVLLQSHASMTMVTAALGAYILADSVIALLGALMVGFGVCGALLLTEGLVGIMAAMASLSESHTAPHNIHAAQLPMIAWALVIGTVEAYIGVRVGLELSAFWRSRRDDNLPRRYLLPPARACLLSGAIAVAFAVSLLALPMASAGIAVPVIGLFAAALAYLRLRGGLTLGALRLELVYSPS